MEECLFCKIIKKEMESNIVYEDDDFIVIMDKFPDSPGHMLIIPKNHIKDLLEIDDLAFKKFNKIIQKMVNLVISKLGAFGVTVTVNYGSCQYIKHYHVHVIPKYKDKKDLLSDEIYKILIEK